LIFSLQHNHKLDSYSAEVKTKHQRQITMSQGSHYLHPIKA